MLEPWNIKSTVNAIWNLDRCLRDLVTDLNNTPNCMLRPHSQEYLKTLHSQLLRLANDDIPAFINRCMEKQNEILAQANRIYDLIDEEDE